MAAPTQPATAPKGADYGEAQASLDRQRAQPVAGAPITPGTPSSSPTPIPQASLSGMMPGEVPTLMDPSARPGEPVTAGLPSGPGPGLEGMNAGAFGPQELSFLRHLYKTYKFEPLRRMIEQMEQNL